MKTIKLSALFIDYDDIPKTLRYRDLLAHLVKILIEKNSGIGIEDLYQTYPISKNYNIYFDGTLTVNIPDHLIGTNLLALPTYELLTGVILDHHNYDAFLDGGTINLNKILLVAANPPSKDASENSLFIYKVAEIILFDIINRFIELQRNIEVTDLYTNYPIKLGENSYSIALNETLSIMPKDAYANINLLTLGKQELLSAVSLTHECYDSVLTGGDVKLSNILHIINNQPPSDASNVYKKMHPKAMNLLAEVAAVLIAEIGPEALASMDGMFDVLNNGCNINIEQKEYNVILDETLAIEPQSEFTQEDLLNMLPYELLPAIIIKHDNYNDMLDENYLDSPKQISKLLQVASHLPIEDASDSYKELYDTAIKILSNVNFDLKKILNENPVKLSQLLFINANKPVISPLSTSTELQEYQTIYAEAERVLIAIITHLLKEKNQENMTSATEMLENLGTRALFSVNEHKYNILFDEALAINTVNKAEEIDLLSLPAERLLPAIIVTRHDFSALILNSDNEIKNAFTLCDNINLSSLLLILSKKPLENSNVFYKKLYQSAEDKLKQIIYSAVKENDGFILQASSLVKDNVVYDKTISFRPRRNHLQTDLQTLSTEKLLSAITINIYNDAPFADGGQAELYLSNAQYQYDAETGQFEHTRNSNKVLKVGLGEQTLKTPAIENQIFIRNKLLGKKLKDGEMEKGGLYYLTDAMGNAAVIMPYIAGQSLDRLIYKQTIDFAAEILENFRSYKMEFFNLIKKIAEIHEHNHVHRDIKPENIILGSNKRLHLIDPEFLISKDTISLTLSGTVPYFPIKMLSGELETTSYFQDIYATLITILQFFRPALYDNFYDYHDVFTKHLESERNADDLNKLIKSFNVFCSNYLASLYIEIKDANVSGEVVPEDIKPLIMASCMKLCSSSNDRQPTADAAFLKPIIEALNNTEMTAPGLLESILNSDLELRKQVFFEVNNKDLAQSDAEYTMLEKSLTEKNKALFIQDLVQCFIHDQPYSEQAFKKICGNALAENFLSPPNKLPSNKWAFSSSSNEAVVETKAGGNPKKVSSDVVHNYVPTFKYGKPSRLEPEKTNYDSIVEAQAICFSK